MQYTDMGDELDHKRVLRSTLIKRFRILEVKAAKFGIECPASISLEIEELSTRISDLDKEITALKKLSGINDYQAKSDPPPEHMIVTDSADFSAIDVSGNRETTVNIGVFREKRFSGGANDFTIYVDNQPVGLIGNGEFVTITSTFGVHEIYVAYSRRSSPDMHGNTVTLKGMSNVLTVELSEEICFLKCGYKKGLMKFMRELARFPIEPNPVQELYIEKS